MNFFSIASVVSTLITIQHISLPVNLIFRNSKETTPKKRINITIIILFNSPICLF